MDTLAAHNQRAKSFRFSFTRKRGHAPPEDGMQQLIPTSPGLEAVTSSMEVPLLLPNEEPSIGEGDGAESFFLQCPHTLLALSALTKMLHSTPPMQLCCTRRFHPVTCMLTADPQLLFPCLQLRCRASG